MISPFSAEERIIRYLENPNIREALRRAAARFAEGRLQALSELGDFKEVRAKTRSVKERALVRIDDIWGRVREHLEGMGVQVVEATDAKEASGKILEILRGEGAELLIKGKSITSEEIRLNPFLEENGVQVLETDLGERIIQLSGEKPSHLIVPAIHKTKEEVAELFSRYFSEEVPPDPYIITKKVRVDLRPRFLSAGAGLTGANVVSEAPVAFYLMTNEGNGRLCATMPAVYITLCGIEKAVESLEDALWVLNVLPRNSVGLKFSSYVSIFKGPFRWKKRRWFVVLLDNGRRKALQDPKLCEALRCIRCGACMNVCPVYRVMSGQAFSHIYMGGIGAVWTAITEGIEEAYKVASLCTGCGSCDLVCPVEIPISRLVEEVRSRAEKRHPIENIGPKVVSRRKKLFASAAEAAKMVGIYPASSPFTARFKKPEGTVNLYVGCVIDQTMPEIAEDAYRVLLSVGEEPAVLDEECCGLPARVYGDKKEYARLSLKNRRMFAKRPTVFVCDTCLSAFIEYQDPEIEPLSLAEFLLEKGARFSCTRRLKAAVHIPCHLKIHEREGALMKFLEGIEGLELVRDPREAECCGAAGLYRVKYPEVSRAVFDTKAEMVLETGPDLLITTCPSCLTQLKEELRKRHIYVEVLHLAQFLMRFTRCISPSSASEADTGKQSD